MPREIESMAIEAGMVVPALLLCLGGVANPSSTLSPTLSVSAHVRPMSLFAD